MKKIVLLVVILCWLCAPNTQAQSVETALPYATWNVPTPENVSPVETSYNEYASLIDWRQSGSSRDLRTAPQEYGTANKEVWAPIGDANWWMATMALLLYVAYKYRRIRRGVLHTPDNEANGRNDEHLSPSPSPQERGESLPLGGRLVGVAIVALLLCFTTAHSAIIVAPDNFFVATDEPYTPTALDVLVNDYYSDDCLLSELVVTIKAGPVLGGSADYDPDARAIMYMPGVTNGEDSLTYTVRCPGMLLGDAVEGKVYIHVKSELKDVISDATCFTKPQGITFGIKELARYGSTAEIIDHLYSPIFGDIDNDGKVEILAYQTSTGSYGNNNNLLIFNLNGTAISKKYTIPITGFTNNTKWANENTLIAKITGTDSDNPSDGLQYYYPTASIFMYHNFNFTLNRYDLKSGAYTLTWSKPAQTNSNYNYALYSPFVADLMGDGHQQIICGDRVYNADTGQLLMVATNASGAALVQADNKDVSFGRLGHHSNESPQRWWCAPVAVDVDNDGIQEIVGGNCVYKVQISDYTSNNAANTYRLWRKANYQSNLISQWSVTHTNIADGATAIADIDLDGQVDVVVTTKGITPLGSASVSGVYAYNPRTGQLLHTNMIQNIPNAGFYGPGRPFVGDIDNDGYPEICLTANAVMDAYKLNAGTLGRMWRLSTTDTSASTGLSLFDFDQSGMGRMVYRDISTLRIIHSTPTAAAVDYTFGNNNSATANEYPPVGDLDGDGHAEIVTISYEGAVSSMRIYAASGAEKWAPARKVWHQASYNPTFINEDLTVPRHPLSPAAKFVAADGTVSRPFNNFLQQATLLNTTGQMTVEASDLAFKPGAPKRIQFDASGNMTVTVTLTNLGGIAFAGNFPLYMYGYTSAADSYAQFYVHTVTNISLAKNNDMVVTFTVPAASIPTCDGLAATINLTSGFTTPAVYAGQTECRYLNNRTQGFNMLSGYTILCKGTTGTVSINETGVYDVFWFTDGNSPSVNSTASDTYIFGPKNSDPMSHMLVKAKYKNTETWVSALMDTVYIYRAADTLVWNGSQANGDWNDYGNWTNPNDPLSQHTFANVPMPCTNVLLPGTTNNYPDLSQDKTTLLPFSPAGSTVANRVHFNFGGEIKRPDRLTYDSAFVKMKLDAHRWYMLAPPLKQTYAGDFYLNSTIPVLDVLKSYTRLWSRAVPYSTFHSSDWSSLFFIPEVPFQKGQGIGMWISSNDNVQRSYELQFPKWDASYNVYYEDTEIISPDFPPVFLSRTEAFRFIFDGSGVDGADFDLTATAGATGDFVMVANPFMAHLDFDLFYAENSSKIQNRYRVLDASGDFKYYKIGESSDLSKDIAPMQAFIVEAKMPFTALTASGLMTATVPTNTLKSARATDDAPAVNVQVSVRQGSASSRTRLKLSNAYSAGYHADEDIAGLYEMESVGKDALEIYSVSSDGLKLNLNSLPATFIGNGGIIPLGVRTSKPDRITINVSNLPALMANGNKVYLYDARNQTDYDLGATSMYTFDAPETDVNNFADNRFYLKIVKSGEGVQPETGEHSVSVVSRHGQLTVTAIDSIEEIAVYDLQGRLVQRAKPKSVTYQTALAKGNFYVVKVKVNGKTVVRKVMC